VRSARVAVCLLAAAWLSGCASVQRTAWQLNVPGVSAPFRVELVTNRAGFLDATLSSEHVVRRIFADGNDPVCRGMLVPGEEISWGSTEPFGPLKRGDERCSISGIGDLERWRDSRGRRRTARSPVLRSTVRYRIAYRGEGFVLARGGFSMGALFGWSPGTDQAFAMLLVTPPCDLADRDGFATVEYRASGRTALGIVTPQGLCRIEGLISAPREPAEPVR